MRACELLLFSDGVADAGNDSRWMMGFEMMCG